MSKRVPEGWSRSTLGKVAKLTMGQSPSSDTYNTENNGLPFFQGNADFGSRYPRVRYWCNEPTKIANEQSILFSVRAPVGEVNIAPYECCIGRGLAAIDGEKVHQEFLYQKLQHAKPQFQLLSQGSTFEAVNGSDLKEFDLVLPPVPEQQKIAAILSSVDDVIEKTRAQIDKLKDLKAGMMQELLTKGIGHTELKDSPVGRVPIQWKVCSLSDVLTLNYGKSPKDVIIKNGLYSVWGTGGETAKTDDYLYEGESIVIGRKGTIDQPRYVSGRFWVIDTAYFSTNHRGNNIRFLYYLIQRLRLRSLNEASGVPSLSRETLYSVKVALPALDEQERIAAVIYSVEENISSRKERLKSLLKIKKALMQDLLTGTVRVNVD